MPLQRGERYHATIGRSVTDFTVVQRRTGSLLFCGANGRSWPLAAAAVGDGRGSFRG